MTFQHFAIESLEYTLRFDARRLRQLQMFRAKPAPAEYEMTDVVTETEFREAFQLAKELKQAFLAWLRAEHPELYEKLTR